MVLPLTGRHAVEGSHDLIQLDHVLVLLLARCVEPGVDEVDAILVLADGRPGLERAGGGPRLRWVRPDSLEIEGGPAVDGSAGRDAGLGLYDLWEVVVPLDEVRPPLQHLIGCEPFRRRVRHVTATWRISSAGSGLSFRKM